MISKNSNWNSELVDQLNSTTAKFFLLPNEEKNKFARQKNNHGYDSIGSEKLVTDN